MQQFIHKDIRMSYIDSGIPQHLTQVQETFQQDQKSTVGYDFTILFLHNGGTSSIIWKHQLDSLSHKYRTIAVDLPGFGESSRSERKIDLNDYAELLEAFINKLNLSKVLLVGNCMGSNIAFKLSSSIQNKPTKNKIVGIIFINPLTKRTFEKGKIGWLYSLEHRIPKPTKLVLDISRKVTPPKFIAKTVVYFQVGKRQNYKSVSSDSKLVACNMRKEQLPALIDVLEDMDSYGSFDNIQNDSIKVPTMVVLGRKNNVLSFPRMKQLAERIGPNEYRELDDCGHLPMLEDPSTITDLILEFIHRYIDSDIDVIPTGSKNKLLSDPSSKT